VLALAGCFGTETGNPSFQGLVAVDPHSSDPAHVSIRVTSDLVVDEVWLSIGPIGLLPAATCARADGAFAAPLGSADHAEPAPAFAPIELRAGRYCELVAPFVAETAPPAGAPPELAGRAIVVLAHLRDGTRIRVVSARIGDVRVPGVAGAFDVDMAQSDFLLGMDVARWLGPLDLSGATREMDGSILLDDTHNVALRDQFDANVPGGLELYRDDGDGILDPTPILVARGS
jgi:hypothetical protein